MISLALPSAEGTLRAVANDVAGEHNASEPERVRGRESSGDKVKTI